MKEIERRRTFMKQTRKKGLGIILALAMILSLLPASALALAVDPDISNVKQSGNLTTFTKDASLVSIRIDESKLKDTENSHASVEFLQQEEYPGFVEREPDMSVKREVDDNKAFNIENYIVYDQSVSGAKQLTAEEDNFFEGDIYSVRFHDAAILSDGSRADLLMTVSNVHIALQTNLATTFDGYVYLTKGVMLRGGNTTTKDIDNTTRNGVQCDINFRIVRSGADEPVDGTFFYGVRDLDVIRDNRGFNSLVNAEKVNSYSEQVRVSSQYDSAIYVPDADNGLDYKLVVSQTDEGVLFAPQASPNTFKDEDPGTFLTGFATVVDNGNGGIDITAWTAGSKTAAVRTILFNAEYSYHEYHSSTTIDGTIQTTANGNLNGMLDDSSNVFGPGILGVPDGKEVRYTITPEEGFDIGDIIIDGYLFPASRLRQIRDVPEGIVAEYPEDGGVNVFTLFYDIRANGWAVIFNSPSVGYPRDHEVHVSWVTSLQLTKQVVDSDEPEIVVPYPTSGSQSSSSSNGKSFLFDITLSGLEDGEYEIDKTNAPNATEETKLVVSDGTGSLTVRLKDNESIRIQDLPSGTEYMITEKIPAGAFPYRVRHSITSGGNVLHAKESVTTGPQTLIGFTEVCFRNRYVKPFNPPTNPVEPKPAPTPVPGDLNGDDHFAYIVGYPDGTVQPGQNITRAEVATIFFRLLW
ncbi:MAG: S-layer homology domain-containing protein, partial [Clostridia bacterium]|nr:S-layer homology domain-containing protein [Clostridia bacterium]